MVVQRLEYYALEYSPKLADPGDKIESDWAQGPLDWNTSERDQIVMNLEACRAVNQFFDWRAVKITNTKEVL